jgi:hypothetical protein
VLDELLWSYPELPYRDIVYMASASSIADFAHTVVPLLQKADRTIHFYNLMLHPLNDAQELSYWGSVPLGSLLVWIDDMYQEPESWTDRRLGNWFNVHPAKHIFPRDAQERMLFRVFERSPEPYENVPVKHNEFNNTEMQFWRPEFWGKTAVGWSSGVACCMDIIEANQ